MSRTTFAARFRWFTAALALLSVVAGDFSRHHDTGLVEQPFGESAEQHLVFCDGRTPHTVHLHRDIVRQIDSCAACLLQHIKVTSTRSSNPAPLAVVQTLVSRRAASRLPTAPRVSASRGPPPISG